MAIALDNSTNGGLVNPGTSLTYAHTVSGSNRILFVSVFGDTTDKITGVTYNGVSMTLVGKTVKSPDRYVYLFYLIAPATGTNNVVVSASSSIAICSHAVSYTGAAQTGQPDSSITGTAATSLTLTTTVVASNCWLVGAWRTNVTTGTAGTGATQRQGSNGLYTADSNGVVGTGSQSMTYNTAGSNGYSGVMASFAPASGGSSTYNESVSEAGSASETLTTVVTLLATGAESASASDTSSTVLTAVGALSEAGSASESCSATGTLTGSCAESGSISDTLSSVLTAVAAVDESGTATDYVNWGGTTYSVTVEEAASAADAQSTTLVAGALLSEAGSAAETLSCSAVLTGAVSEGPSAVDTLSALAVLTSTVAEALAAADTVTVAGSLTEGRTINLVGRDTTTKSLVGYDTTTIEVLAA